MQFVIIALNRPKFSQKIRNIKTPRSSSSYYFHQQPVMTNAGEILSLLPCQFGSIKTKQLTQSMHINSGLTTNNVI